VGSSALDLDDRWSQHKSDLRKNKHDNQHLRNAWNKYGAKNFIFVVLEIVEPLKCLEREQFYIDNIKPKYNICKIAGSPLGYKHTIESKLKMSINAKKHNLSRKIPIQQLNKKTKTLIKVWDSMSDAAQNI
jgi:group I intron endonuclease